MEQIGDHRNRVKRPGSFETGPSRTVLRRRGLPAGVDSTLASLAASSGPANLAHRAEFLRWPISL
jgi:hypothetical protein